eukprot:g8085.t1
MACDRKICTGGHQERELHHAGSSVACATTPKKSATRAEFLCLDAFRVVLNDHDGSQRRGWFSSTVNLSMASLQFCVACRIARLYHVRIATFSPWLKNDRHEEGESTQQQQLSVATNVPEYYSSISSSCPRIPRLRARRVTWELSTAQSDGQLTADLERLMVFGDDMNDDVEEALFPPLLQELSFSRDFKRATVPLTTSGGGGGGGGGVRGRDVASSSLQELIFGSYFNEVFDESFELPKSLTRLNMGSRFNRPLNQIRWPRAMRHLALGWRFDQDVRGLALPPCLHTLEFGFSFNRPIAGVALPASLHRLTFGDMFNEPIDGVRQWPAYLRHLEFGSEFNQQIQGVSWPPLLLELSFGWKFNQPVVGVAWPTSLERLSFGWKFNHPVTGVEWPASLKFLEFGHDFDQPVAGVVWPASLQRLEFGARFHRPLENVALPPSLLQLVFGYQFNYPIDRVAWPASLRQLTLGGRFDHPVRGLPETLTELVLLLDRDIHRHPLAHVQWPRGLRTLTIPGGVSLDAVVLPSCTRTVRYR